MRLYSRENCPLCEDVENTLIRLNINYEFIDIDLDEKLLKKYHVKVPVLLNDNNQELFWPFNEAKIEEFIAI